MIHSLDLPGYGRIHAESEGTGPAIVFVHADFVDERMWDSVRGPAGGPLSNGGLRQAGVRPL